MWSHRVYTWLILQGDDTYMPEWLYQGILYGCMKLPVAQ